MINFFLLLLFFYQGIYGSGWKPVCSSSFSSVKNRFETKLPLIRMETTKSGGVFFSIVKQQDVGIFSWQNNRDLSSQVNKFVMLQNTLKAGSSKGTLGYNKKPFVLRSFRQVQTTSDSKQANDYYDVENNFPRIEVLEENFSNSGDCPLIFQEKFKSGDNSSLQQDLLAASVCYAVTQGCNIVLPIDSTVDKDRVFDDFIKRVPAGIPLSIQNNCPEGIGLEFKQLDFKSLARVVIGMDKNQSFNIFTFVHGVEFFSRGTAFKIPDLEKFIQYYRLKINGEVVKETQQPIKRTPKIAPERPSKKGRNKKGDATTTENLSDSGARKKIILQKHDTDTNADYSSDEDLFDTDELQKNHSVSYVNGEKTFELDFFALVNDLLALHGDLLKKGLTSESLVEALFSLFAGNEYKEKVGIEAINLYMADAKSAVQQAGTVETKNPKLTAKNPEQHLPKQKSWWQKVPLMWGLQYIAYIYLSLGVLKKTCSLIKKAYCTA